MAIRRRRLAACVVGLSRKQATLRQAVKRGAIDTGTTDFRKAVKNSDLVVLATPVDLIVPLGKRLSASMKPGSILTDVGSVKGSIVRALEAQMPSGVSFIGAHPLAGSEKRGIDAACAGLFDGSVCIVTPTAATNRKAQQKVTQLWNRILRRVVPMSPTRHDRLLAQVSHLPHTIAFSLVNAAHHEALSIAPRSFLDATRVAESDPSLWDDILSANRGALLDAMRLFEMQYGKLRRILKRNDRAALLKFLASAKKRRHDLENR